MLPAPVRNCGITRKRSMSLADELQKLQTLREKGALTEEEFAAAKKRVLEASAETEAPKPAGDASGATSSALHQFQLSNSDRWIGGVCGGLADISGVPSWMWRILFLLTALLHGLGLIVYVLLWIFVPRRPQASLPAKPT
jgi:phage shock protein PspC (stress-responsive transcriptional regulator)